MAADSMIDELLADARERMHKSAEAAQHERLVAVALPAQVAHARLTDQHASGVVADQRNGRCGAVERQPHGVARQPPRLRGHRLPPRQVGHLHVEPFTAQQPHEDGGEVGVRARDDEPAGLQIGQHRVEISPLRTRRKDHTR